MRAGFPSRRAYTPSALAGLAVLYMAILTLSSSAAYAQTQPLGRLFFTPERRAVLERQRQLNIQEKTQETIEVASLHLNGVVRRSGNKTTVWVNGRPQAIDNANAGIQAIPSAKEADRVGIRVGEENPASLRVGETLNRATQEMTNGLAGGQLQINRGDGARLPNR